MKDININEQSQHKIVTSSAKLVVLDQILKMWLKNRDHKCLIFAQGIQMLNILELYIKNEGYEYRRMDGMTNISHRQELIDEFNTNSDISVFLLTTRVGVRCIDYSL